MITNKDGTIDSRDIIERIEELSNMLLDEYEDLDTPLTFSEWLDLTIFEEDTLGQEYKILTALAAECSDYAGDWVYGEALIHEDYFEHEMDEMLKDCGYIPKNLPSFLTLAVDYDALKQDYTEVDFDGETYYVRSC